MRRGIESEGWLYDIPGDEFEGAAGFYMIRYTNYMRRDGRCYGVGAAAGKTFKQMMERDGP